MSVYPLIWVNDVACNSVDNGFGLHPDHPPRVVGAPTMVSVSVPGRDGELNTPQGATLPSLFVVTLRVRGSGATVDDQYAHVEQIISTWGRVIRAPRIVLKQQVAASGVGSVLYAEARLATPPTRERESGVLVHEKFTMTFQVTGAFWSDQPPGTPSFTFSQVPAVSGTKYVVDSVASTAPLLDAQIRITGPAVNPRYTDYVTGDWVQYNGTVASGTQLRLDLAKFKAWSSSSWVSNDWSTAGTDVSGSMFIGGNAQLYTPTMVRLTPGLLVSAGAATLTGIEGTLTGTGFTSATRLEVRGRRAHG